MKKYTYIILLDVQYYFKEPPPALNVQYAIDSFKKTCKFFRECNASQRLENCIIVYANNWNKIQEDVAILENVVSVYNSDLEKSRELLFKECYTIQDIEKLTEKYPPRKIFLTGGNLTGCMINESLSINYYSLSNIQQTYVVPELGYDQDDLYTIWQIYQHHEKIEICTLEHFRDYLFEQSIRNRGFLYTREENDYEIYVKCKNLFKQR